MTNDKGAYKTGNWICEQCARNRNKTKDGSEFIPTESKLEMIGIYILEIEQSYVLNMIEYFTSTVKSKLISDKKIETIISSLHEWSNRYCKPEMFITDQWKEFKNSKTQDCCKNKKINHYEALIDHHESNRRIERYHRTLREMLKVWSYIIIRRKNKNAQ